MPIALDRGKSLDAVMKACGHADASATDYYLHALSEGSEMGHLFS